MKKILMYFLFFVSLFATYNIMASTLDCYDNETGCNGVNWGPIICVATNYPLFPGYDCKIYVCYKTRVCGNEYQIYIDHLEFRMSLLTCTGLADWLFVNGQINYDHWNQLYDFCYQSLTQYIFVQGTQGDKTSYMCPNYNSSYANQFVYFKSQCGYLCYWTEGSDLDPYNPDHPYRTCMKTGACGTGDCCKIEINYCWNPDGTISKQVIPIAVATPQDCENNPLPDCNFPLGAHIPWGSQGCHMSDCLYYYGD